MGNVMTPFFPPQAAFIPKVINLLASGPYRDSFYVDITAAQAQNNIFYLSGTATAAFGSTTKLMYFFLPTTASTKVYTFNVGNITQQPTSGPTAETLMGIVSSSTGDSILFNVNTTFQIAYSASGYGSAGVPTIVRTSATNIAFASTVG